MQEMWVRSLGQEDPLEKEMGTHSSILAWKILHGQRSWAGYSGKKTDRIERLTLLRHQSGNVSCWPSSLSLSISLEAKYKWLQRSVGLHCSSDPISPSLLSSGHEFPLTVLPQGFGVFGELTSNVLTLTNPSPPGKPPCTLHGVMMSGTLVSCHILSAYNSARHILGAQFVSVEPLRFIWQ